MSRSEIPYHPCRNSATVDRLIFAGLYRLGPIVFHALAALKPDVGAVSESSAFFYKPGRFVRDCRPCHRPSAKYRLLARPSLSTSTANVAQCILH
jgi:hypothetical protein